jgi:hypothetical protein
MAGRVGRADELITETRTAASRFELAVSASCTLLALLPVAALLAWVFGLGSFQGWFLWVSLPAVLLLGAVGVFARRLDLTRLRTVLVAGAFGGLVGTIGYDLFRVPFAAVGLRVFAPIDSYGILVLDASSSNAWTGLAGWAYHFSNGIGFGIAYAIAALGRRWWWGVLWGMILETATIVTPYAGEYGLSGQWGLIGIAYAAHFAYGAPLGLIVQRGRDFVQGLDEMSRRATVYMLAALCAFLLLWHRPLGESLATAIVPSTTITETRFDPEWLRVAPGGCARLVNRDQTDYRIEVAAGAPVVGAGRFATMCFEDLGIHRVRIGKQPFSGGFVIVDEKAS